MVLLRCTWIVVSVVALSSLGSCSCGNNSSTNQPDASVDSPGTGGCPGAGETDCNGACVNTEVNPDNCGACGTVCSASQVCLSSGCANSCPAQLSACDRTCVDRDSDNANCGTCGNACGAGMGCVGGTCVPAVTVGPDPAKCVGGGPPTTVDPGTGTPTCTGGIVGTTFTYGLCTCHDIGVPAISSRFYIDAFNSKQAPYVPGGQGGSCGANDSINMTAVFEVTGDVRTTGTPGLTVGDQLTVGQSLRVAGTLDLLNTLTVGLDAFVGAFSGNQSSTIAGDLFTPNCANKPSGVTVGGSCTSGAITVDPPCRCAPGDIVQIQTLVTHFSNPANNDNASIGLDPAVFASTTAPGRLELPCGYYYLSAVNGSSERVIGVHGRTAIFIGASINASSPITFALTPGATLDVFIAGDVTASAQFNSGSPAYPSHSRFWVSGNVTMTSNSILNGLFYVPNGTFEATSDLEMFGSIFAGNYDASSQTLIHQDQAAAQAGEECPDVDPPAVCGATYGQACTTNTDCCQPLYCLGDNTCGYVIL